MTLLCQVGHPLKERPPSPALSRLPVHDNVIPKVAINMLSTRVILSCLGVF
jgi:hypothetical protein